MQVLALWSRLSACVGTEQAAAVVGCVLCLCITGRRCWPPGAAQQKMGWMLGGVIVGEHLCCCGWFLLCLLIPESVSRMEADCHLFCGDAIHHHGILLCLFVDITNQPTMCGVPVLVDSSEAVVRPVLGFAPCPASQQARHRSPCSLCSCCNTSAGCRCAGRRVT